MYEVIPNNMDKSILLQKYRIYYIATSLDFPPSRISKRKIKTVNAP